MKNSIYKLIFVLACGAASFSWAGQLPPPEMQAYDQCMASTPIVDKLELENWCLCGNYGDSVACSAYSYRADAHSVIGLIQFRNGNYYVLPENGEAPIRLDPADEGARIEIQQHANQRSQVRFGSTPRSSKVITVAWLA